MNQHPNGRTDVPMGGIWRVQADLESLDHLIVQSRQQVQAIDPEFIRTIVLGIMAQLDAAIVTILES